MCSYVQNAVAKELLSWRVISCCVLTRKLADPGWPGLGPACTTPSCWYEHCNTRKLIRRSVEQTAVWRRMREGSPGSNAQTPRTPPRLCQAHCWQSVEPCPSLRLCVCVEGNSLDTKEITAIEIGKPICKDRKMNYLSCQSQLDHTQMCQIDTIKKTKQMNWHLQLHSFQN